MLSSLHVATGPCPRWHGLRPVALRPATRRWHQPACRPSAVVRVAAVGDHQPVRPYSDSDFTSAVEQRRRREWEATRQELAAFQQAHGRLPRHTANALGPLAEGEGRLARWCTLQQRRKEGSAGSPLSAEERAALESIPGWQCLAARRAVQLPWEARLQQVAGFVAQHGRLPRGKVSPTSPTRALALEEGLGRWCSHQRQRRKGNAKLELTAEQVAALEAIPGWVWEEIIIVPWDVRRQQVADFVAQHGRLPRKSIKPTSPTPALALERELGRWCSRQLQRRKGNLQPELTVEEAAALDAIPGWCWEEFTALPWKARLQQLVGFVQQHGRLPRKTITPTAPPPLPLERELGGWCQGQRVRQRTDGVRGGKLTPVQVASLEAVPGWVWDEQVPWEQRLEQVAAFQQQHGRLPRAVIRPTVEPLERELGAWCGRQRQRRKGDARQGRQLTAEQEAALEAMPGWFWEEVLVPWEVRLQQLGVFVAQHGRLPRKKVSPTSPTPAAPGEVELGRWCQRQRERRKGQGKPLTAEKVAALEAVPGWVWEEFTREDWGTRLQQVRAFQQQHGRLPRERGGKRQPLLEGEGELGQWCSRQRQRRKGNRAVGSELTAAQQAALEAIPGWQWADSNAWLQRLAQLEAFVAAHGRLPRSVSGGSNPILEGEQVLGKWCCRQRQRQKGYQPSLRDLTAEQVAALEAVPGWFW